MTKLRATPAESNTPRTDALAARLAAETGLGVGKLDPAEGQNLLWNHARQLERELADSQALITRLEDEILYGPEGNV
jgi:hypothetical protein